MPAWALLIAAGATIAGGGYFLLPRLSQNLIDVPEIMFWMVCSLAAGGAVASAGVIIGIIQWVTA